jgi:hypothetical protein
MVVSEGLFFLKEGRLDNLRNSVYPERPVVSRLYLGGPVDHSSSEDPEPSAERELSGEKTVLMKDEVLNELVAESVRLQVRDELPTQPLPRPPRLPQD